MPPHESGAVRAARERDDILIGELERQKLTMIDASVYDQLVEHADRLAEVLRIVRSVEDNEELRKVLAHVLDRYEQVRANAPR